MPRYFFDLNDGREVRDERGMEMPGPDAARERAVQVMTDYIQEPDRLSPDGVAVVVDARDGAGHHVATARLVLSVAER